MFEIALFEPEIPPNTGNIIRLGANTGINIHLIEPLGFSIDDKQMRRAGLDYHKDISLNVHKNFNEFLEKTKDKRIFAVSTKGEKYYHEINYKSGDIFLFGPESRGLPQNILEQFSKTLIRIPMQKNSRSLNLSNTAAILAYEALRQTNFINLS